MSHLTLQALLCLKSRFDSMISSALTHFGAWSSSAQRLFVDRLKAKDFSLEDIKTLDLSEKDQGCMTHLMKGCNNLLQAKAFDLLPEKYLEMQEVLEKFYKATLEHEQIKPLSFRAKL